MSEKQFQVLMCHADGSKSRMQVADKTSWSRRSANKHAAEHTQKYGVRCIVDPLPEVKPIVVIVPSQEGEEGNLIFIAPGEYSRQRIEFLVNSAIAAANDDKGERSEEVITFLHKQCFKFVGNPKTERVIVTRPWI